MFDENEMMKHLVCYRCGRVFEQPSRLHRCGHTFCRGCCPVRLCHICSCVVEDLQPDLTASGLIANMRGRCQVKNCPFSGILSIYLGSYDQFLNDHIHRCGISSENAIEIMEPEIPKKIELESLDLDV